MLVLSRKINESIVIDGRIIVKVVRVEGEHVKLGIEAPNTVPVHRQEIYDEIQKNNREALRSERTRPPRLASRDPHPPEPVPQPAGPEPALATQPPQQP